ARDFLLHRSLYEFNEGGLERFERSYTVRFKARLPPERRLRSAGNKPYDLCWLKPHYASKNRFRRRNYVEVDVVIDGLRIEPGLRRRRKSVGTVGEPDLLALRRVADRMDAESIGNQGDRALPQIEVDHGETAAQPSPVVGSASIDLLRDFNRRKNCVSVSRARGAYGKRDRSL